MNATDRTDDIIARATAALEGVTEGPWATDGVLIGCELVTESPGITSYRYAIAEMDEDAYDEEGGPGEYDGEVFRPYEQMEADAEFLAASRQLIPDLVAEVERLRRGGRRLGELLRTIQSDVLDATDSRELIGEDGDGDWMAVFERLSELRPARDEARAVAKQLRAALTEIDQLHVDVRDICDECVCGNCGGNPCETAQILDKHGITR